MDHTALLGTAAVIGFLHTLLGPDHYLPFVAMARIGRWSTRKTLVVTVLCGLAHVASSVLLGAVGIAGGVVLLRLEELESHRAELAGWLLLGFGVAYLVWGLLHAFRGLPHTHLHAHIDGTVHQHEHVHHGEHLHAHVPVSSGSSDSPGAETTSIPPATASGMTPWVLFTIFLFGPCEPLIPVLMYPASEANVGLVVLVAAVFTLVTVGTMTVAVMAMLRGVSFLSLGSWQRFGHALAGLAVTGCGLAVKIGL